MAHYKDNKNKSQLGGSGLVLRQKVRERISNQRNNTTRYTMKEDHNPMEISMSIPLLMRLLEYSREEIEDDNTLHNIVEKMISLNKCLDMSDFDIIINDK